MMNAKKNEAGTEKPLETPAATEAAPASRKRPIHHFREGPIHVSVWPHDFQTRDGTITYYSVTIQRAYEDKKGLVKYTNSFHPDSLENLARAVQRVSEYLQNLMQPEKMLPNASPGQQA